MESKGKQVSKMENKATRASVTFPAEIYAEVEQIAVQKKVSVAWVVRDAVEKYVAAQYPLFEPK